MRNLLLKTLFFAQVAIQSTVYAQEWNGPFGVEMGLTEEQLRKKIPELKKVTDFSFVFTTAPKHFPGTSFYIALISKKSGLCSISAHSTVKSSVFGDAVREKFSFIQSSLTDKYGPPTRSFDFLRNGSLWTDPEDWMIGLIKKERILASFWTKPEDPSGKTSLPPTLSGIALEATAERISAADITIGYEFANFATCSEELKKSRTDVL